MKNNLKWQNCLHVKDKNSSPENQTGQLKTPGKVLKFLPALFLMTATVGFYWPIISLKAVIWNDFIEQYVPFRIFATRALQESVFPFWNPYTFSGMPFFADIQTAVLYPLNLLLCLIPVHYSNPVPFEYQLLFHVFLCGLFMFYLACDFGLSRFSSTASALSIMFGGFTTAHIFHVTMIHALPWILLSTLTLRRTLERKSLKYAAFTGIILSLITFAGHPQLLLYTYYWLTMFLLFHLFTICRKSGFFKNGSVSLSLFILTIALGGGLSAVQLLPTQELRMESARPEMSYIDSNEGAFNPYRLVTMLVPNLYGSPREMSEQNPYWGFGNADVKPGPQYYWETALYTGVVSLFFAIIAVTVLSSAPILFLLIMLIITFLLAMGDTGFIYKLFYNILPGFRMFRDPARIGLFTMISISLLSAFGLSWFETIDKNQVKAKRRLIIASVVLSISACLIALLFQSGAFKGILEHYILKTSYFGIGQDDVTEYSKNIYNAAKINIWVFAIVVTWMAMLIILRLQRIISLTVFSFFLLALILGELFFYGYGYAESKSDPLNIYAPDDLTMYLQTESDKELFRINSRGTVPGTTQIGGASLLFRRNEGMVHKLCLLEGYNPLRLKRQILDAHPKLLDILNVKYKLTIDEIDRSLGIEQRTSMMPRAWMVYNYRVVSNEDSIISVIKDSAFDHRSSVVLEQEPTITLSGPPSIQPSVTINTFTFNRIQGITTTDKNGLMVISEIFYPSWIALVDGKQVPVYRADYALRAIPIPSGKHTFELVYKDKAFTRGLLITIFTVCVTLLIIIVPLHQLFSNRKVA